MFHRVFLFVSHDNKSQQVQIRMKTAELRCACQILHCGKISKRIFC